MSSLNKIGGSKPTDTEGVGRELHIFKKGKSYSFTVTKNPTGPLAAVTKLFQNVKLALTHIGEKKLSGGETALVAYRAAQLKSGYRATKDGREPSEQELYLQTKIDPIVKALAKSQVLSREVDQTPAPTRAEKAVEEKPLSTKEAEQAEAAPVQTRAEKAVEELKKPLDPAKAATIKTKVDTYVSKDKATHLKDGARDFWRGAKGVSIKVQHSDGQTETLADGRAHAESLTKTGAPKGKIDDACTKELLGALAQKYLSGKELDNFMAALESADLSAQDKALEWIAAQAKSPKFQDLMTCFSQAVTIQQGEIVAQLNPSLPDMKLYSRPGEGDRRSIEVTFLPNGNIQLNSVMAYRALSKTEFVKLEDGQIKERKLASFDYSITYEFDPSMKCTKVETAVANFSHT